MDGYDAPRITQFNVFLDNRVGKLMDLVDSLSARGLSIVGLSILDTVDHAVVRVVTSRSALARDLLKKREFPFSEVDVMAVTTPPPDGLAKLCRALLSAEVGIHYAYPLLVRPNGLPAVVLYTDEPEMTVTVLRRKSMILLGESDLHDVAADSDSDG